MKISTHSSFNLNHKKTNNFNKNIQPDPNGGGSHSDMAQAKEIACAMADLVEMW
ncbi:gliding motility protein [Sesbania bispinosa]|nr:gliding motility protein [Sesbania bispinosa]